MEKTLAMITESIIKQIKPHITDDQDISEPWIDDEIDDVRAALVPVLYNANDSFQDWHQEVILEAVKDISVTIDGYTFLFKTPISIITLPGTLMQGMRWKNILYMGAHGFEALNYQRVTMTEFQEYEYHRFGNRMPCYVVDGDRILLKNVGLQTHFKGIFCFSRPSCVTGYNRKTTRYPLPLSLHHKLEIVVFQHIAPKLGLPVDVISNNTDETRTGNMQQAVKESQREQ